MYQPFGDDQKPEFEELDEEFLETGIHRRKPKTENVEVLSGPMAKEFYLHRYEAALDRIELAIEEEGKSLYAVNLHKKQNKQTLVYNYVFLGVVSFISYLWLQLMWDHNFVVFVISLVFLVGAIGGVLRRAIRDQIEYLIRCHPVNKPNQYIESAKILTYEKEASYHESCIKELLMKKAQIEEIRVKVDREITLEKEDVSMLDNKYLHRLSPCRYKECHPTLFRYLKARV